MDILNYSPKSLSELSGGSCTPLSQIQCTDTMPITQSDVKVQNDGKTNELINSVIAAPANVTASVINAGGVATAPHTESAYVDEIYTKISEYYRGIFSNLDLKDPNINEDVLNYYQLIRQFYEQTMAANIQRNKVTGFNATALPTDGGKCPATIADVSTIDLTISKPTPLAPFVGINESFRNNININIENNGNDGGGGGAGGSGNGVAKVNAANLNVKPIDTVATTENKVTISSAGVSINVSSSLNSNSLKISCNTTPPKKRYSIYNHPNDTDQTIQNKSTAINLNAKFNAARHENGTAISLPSAPTTTTTPTAIATNNSTAAAAATATSIDAMRMRNSGGDGSGNGNPITDIIPITSTYLQLMRSMGFSEEDAMRFDNVVSFSFNIRFLFIIIIRRLPSHFPLRNKAIAFNRVFYYVSFFCCLLCFLFYRHFGGDDGISTKHWAVYE